MKEVRSFFEALTGPFERENIRNLAKAIVKFCNGEFTDLQMERALMKIQ